MGLLSELLASHFKGAEESAPMKIENRLGEWITERRAGADDRLINEIIAQSRREIKNLRGIQISL
jgi:hypothetical protein